MLVGLAPGRLPPTLALLTLAFVGLLLENQLLHEAADAREDAEAGVRTTFLAFGPRVSAALAALAGVMPVAALALAWPTRVGVLLAAAIGVVFVLIVPRSLALQGADALSMARARLLHRGAGFVLGAVLFVVVNR